MRRPLGGAALVALSLAGCGGGGGNPVAPPPPPEGFDVVVTVFYDANENGVLDASEPVRVPGAVVEIGGKSGRSEPGTGRAVVQGVPRGSYTASLRASSLPPFYVAGAPVPVEAPQPAGQQVSLAATLPIGGNHPGTYMAFGDSITVGEGSTDDTGYRLRLQGLLQQDFGAAQVLNRGDDGTRSAEGAERITRGLRALQPAYTLTMYGTNDYNDEACRTAFPCFTIQSLREILLTVKDRESLPVLATIPPVNPALESQQRIQWVKDMNVLVRDLAREQGAVLADVEAAFGRESDVPGLFWDHVHPNDRGYDVIARTFKGAIEGAAASAGLRRRGFFFALAP